MVFIRIISDSSYKDEKCFRGDCDKFWTVWLKRNLTVLDIEFKLIQLEYKNILLWLFYLLVGLIKKRNPVSE